MKGTEANTQAACLELLAAHNIFAGRLNTGAGFINGRPVQHHTFGRGCADILAFPRVCNECVKQDGLHGAVRPTWIEVKSPTGKQSPEQVSFQQYVEKLGHNYLLIRDIDQLVFWLETIS